MTFEAIKQSVVKFVKDEAGLTTVEYAVAGSLVAGAVIIAFTGLGTAVTTEINRLATCIAGNGTTGC
ncbi:Flp family type IVb pilin [Pseudomonas sp. BN415]|uniref:Flp family type IVb pilin n=1 Tax=Pseudomonadaceae TaxID=135621 RepID=UPI0009DC3299|nr:MULTISPECIES: pilus assembly protein [Pseudomonas]MDH4582119.1 Flp family type IVb pilin [Pseudomonas sp. BN415]